MVPLALIAFFSARATWNIYLKDRDSVVELQTSQERLAKLEGRQAELSVATAKLSSESGIEGEIRDRYQMARQGEKEVVIVENPSSNQATLIVKKGFFQKIIDFFMKR